MFSKKSMSLIAVLGLLIFSVYATAGPNANAVLSLDLIADGGAGNRTDDGITSGTVSGQGTTIAIEIFATGVRTSLIGMTLEFDFDSSLLSFVKAENSAFPLTLPEGSTGTHFGTRNPVTLASSGFLARAEFTTVSDVTGTEFSIGIESVTLSESTTSSDELITTSVITFNASPSPDFDGDDWVGFSDFLIFAQVFGSQRGDGTYDARIDLNSDGSIGFTDFLIFAQSFGSAPPSTGGGSPDLVVQSPSVSDNNVASGATFTLGATVRNQGSGSSAATTLHYYRSDDATIDATDTEVGTDAVRGLAAGRASADSISLNAPSDAGTYYYGACVDAVTGESDSGNNCSASVTITVAPVAPPATGASKLYWTDWGTDKIQRSNLDGSGVEDLVTTGLESPDRIALDVSGGKMYWTDALAKKIQRSNLDGSGVEDLVTTGLEFPAAIAVDVSGGKMYWTDLGTAKIQRSNLDGSGVEDLVTTGLEGPRGGIALDVSGGKMYWTDFRTAKIQRSNLDGSGVEDLVTTGLRWPYGIAVDVSGGKMYWTDALANKIQRSNLDGSGVEDLVTTGLEGPAAIALDVSGGKMYWTNLGTAKIQRSNLDGSGVEDLVTTGLESLGGIALDFVPVEAGTDLGVRASVSDNTLTPGQSFTLSVTVRNHGTEQAAATTLRYYRSDDATIDATDTEVGTDGVSSLSAGDTSAESINLTAPSEAGTYYYGACVDAVTGESDTGNNCSAAVSITVADDRAALVALYEATDGPNWTDKENWSSAAPLGEWYGVTTDDNGRVTNLNLTDNSLQGTIPVELGQLTNLTELDLSSNQLTGAIPVELGQLTKLTWLDLRDNQLTGAIPVELGQLTNLRGLHLDVNTLTGPIPTGLGQLTNLTYLYLSWNQLTGAIPVELGQLTNLTTLWLSSNQLTGAIPVELGQLTNLTSLSLFNNQLMGAIPQSLTGLTKLDQFSFFHTGLCAPLNAAFQTWLQGIDEALGENCSGTPPPSGSPDLIVALLVPVPNTLSTGQAFTLGATVRNQGNASSASTTLRYYRSSNATISSRDTEVGTDGVSSLPAGDTSAESISLNAPSDAGTYYYGACVQSVSGESDTGNNCSSGVTVTVSGTPPPSGSPDLIVESPSVNDNTPKTGQSFTLRATVRNQGNASSASTTLRYYRSSNATISSSDTEVGTDGVSSLPAGDTSAESISLNAPSDAGTYYYGACVESVSGESDTGNNCSSGATVTVSATPPPSGSPDLIVESPSVNDNTLTTGQSFTLRATVRNQGNATSASTTLRYYRSSNATISSSDTEVGTDGVSSLSAGDTSAESISLTAPSSAGTYYYGACVDNVSGESDTGNNCSSSVTVTVSGGGGGTSQTCAVGLELNPGDGCSGSGYTLRNDASVLVVDGNIGGIRLSNTRFSGGSVNLNNMRITRSGNVWTIVSLP